MLDQQDQEWLNELKTQPSSKTRLIILIGLYRFLGFLCSLSGLFLISAIPVFIFWVIYTCQFGFKLWASLIFLSTQFLFFQLYGKKAFKKTFFKYESVTKEAIRILKERLNQGEFN